MNIDQMAHEYVVACLMAGKKLDDINITVAVQMAIDLKAEADKRKPKGLPFVVEEFGNDLERNL